MLRALLLWPGVVAAAVRLGRGSYVALVTPMDAANAVDYGALRAVWKSTSVSVMIPSSGEEPTPPRHRAGVASMAWRSTRLFRTNAQ